jgi:hypothetical protein
MNWGIRITILYCSFAFMILLMVYFTMGEKVELVSKDYYAQELKYGQRMDAIENTRSIENELHVEKSTSCIRVFFPEEQISKAIIGNIIVFRPSDSSLDIKIPLNGKTPKHKDISSSQLKPGAYLVKMDWRCDGKNYYWEKEIIF